MTVAQWVELMEEEPWQLRDLCEEQWAELVEVLRFAMATEEIVRALTESLAFYMYADREGKKVSEHFEAATSATLDDACRVSCMQPEAAPRECHA